MLLLSGRGLLIHFRMRVSAAPFAGMPAVVRLRRLMSVMPS